MISDKVIDLFFSKKNMKVLFLFFLISPFLSYSQGKEKLIKFNLTGVTLSESSGKSMEGVKLELQKNKQVIETIITPPKGRFKLTTIFVTTDSNNAEYRLSFSKENMLPKTVSINTYIRKPVDASYDFNLEVNMIERKEDDIIIDLPSAKIKWDTKINKFGFDQKYANIMKKIKEQEDPKKAQELIELQKKEEQKAKQETERKAKEEADRIAKEQAAERKAKEEAEQSIKKNLEAIRLQAEELAKQEEERKAKEEAEKQAAKESIKKSLGSIQKQVEEIKKEEVKAPPVQVVEPEEDNGEQLIIREIYSIRDVKALRAKREFLAKALRDKKIKNYSCKYETENPLTSLLDEIDQYEKELKKQKADKQ